MASAHTLKASAATDTFMFYTWPAHREFSISDFFYLNCIANTKIIQSSLFYSLTFGSLNWRLVLRLRPEGVVGSNPGQLPVSACGAASTSPASSFFRTNDPEGTRPSCSSVLFISEALNSRRGNGWDRNEKKINIAASSVTRKDKRSRLDPDGIACVYSLFLLFQTRCCHCYNNYAF